MGPNIIRYRSQIFADDSSGAGLFQYDAQIFFALSPVRFAVLRGRIIARRKMGGAAACFFQHLIPVEFKELFVAHRSPRKCIDAVKTEHMIDTEHIEDSPNTADSLPPPSKLVRAHCLPVVKGDA